MQEGIAVLVACFDPTTKDPEGHVAIVSPPEPGDKGLMIENTGKKRGRMTVTEGFGFRQVKYFVSYFDKKAADSRRNVR